MFLSYENFKIRDECTIITMYNRRITLENLIDLAKRLRKEDYEKPIEVLPNLYWVGYIIEKDNFQCHPYLLVNGKDSVLFDPGSMITFRETFRKIEEIIPFSNIRYFVCHHQDPDITSALPLIDSIVTRKDAVILSHWRAITLLKHLGLKMQFKCVEKMNWSIDAGNYRIDFIFSPYLHFPGAFVSYIENMKALISSDIFGAISSDFKLIATDESCYEGLKLFHEHYMPSREILLNFLYKIDILEIDAILPQHGSILPKKIIPFVFNRLKEIECGIYTLTQTSTEIAKLSKLNKLLSDITKTIILSSDFKQLLSNLLVQSKELFHIEDMLFITRNEDNEMLFLGHDITNINESIPDLEFYKSLMDLDKTDFNERFKQQFIQLKSMLSHDIDESIWVAPLFNINDDKIIGILQITLNENQTIDTESINTFVQLIPALSAALEREIIRVQLDKEKNEFYQISIRDSLTGLFTRFYMQEMSTRLCNMQDRDSDYKVGIFYFDIDNFKNINDTYGHSSGDIVLKKISNIIIKETRSDDIQVRLGGEELGVVFLSKEWKKSIMLADRIREHVSKLDLSEIMGNQHVTISGGISIRETGEDIETVFNRADRNLYKAKKSGKNKIFYKKELFL